MCFNIAPTMTTTMKNNTQNIENLKSLFVEVVNASLSQNANNTLNMVANTIQHFAQLKPFNTISLHQWHCICSANGVKFSI